MPANFLVSDTHFGHAGVCRFLRDDGTKLRPWDNPEELDEEMVKRWNEYSWTSSLQQSEKRWCN